MNKPHNVRLAALFPDGEEIQIPLILPWERFVALRDLVLTHYKNLANNIEAKIEATKKNMFHKAEATSLPTNDKQRLKKIIEKKTNSD